MLRKGIFILTIIAMIITIYPYRGETFDGGDYEVIPDEAIRLRILANSDSDTDQDLKRKIRDRVNAKITVWVEELDDIKEARRVISEQIPVLEDVVSQVMKEEQMEQEFTVAFDKVGFPTKLYGPYLYPAGEYEAVLITLGDGEGSNWWCVLFPPLCFLDFANGTTVKVDPVKEFPEREVATEVKVRFLIADLISKWFS